MTKHHKIQESKNEQKEDAQIDVTNGIETSLTKWYQKEIITRVKDANEDAIIVNFKECNTCLSEPETIGTKTIRVEVHLTIKTKCSL